MGKREKQYTVEDIVNKTKGEVLKEFEKICGTERSLDRMIREMHDIFDELVEELKERK